MAQRAEVVLSDEERETLERWAQFASTSSRARNNNATAVSRSPSRVASASARSTPQDSPPRPRSLSPGVNAYQKTRTCRPFVSGT